LQDDPEARKAEGQRSPGVYSALVEELIQGLNADFPEDHLAVLTQTELKRLSDLTDDYYKKIGQMKCPEPPANATIQETQAYAKACCNDMSKITDEFIAAYNTIVAARANIVQVRWKEYINALINIVSLEPTFGNKNLVYQNVQAYFAYLASVWNSARFEPKPTMGCDIPLTNAEVDSLISSSRSVSLHCPRGLYLDVDLQVAKVKGDCDKFELEFGKEIIVNFEKNFRSGTATLSTGFSESVRKYTDLKASAKLLGYVSFDNNWNFADVGIKGKAEAGVNSEFSTMDGMAKGSSWIVGGEAGFSVGLESGFKTYVKGKGVFSEFQTLEYNTKW
jgi:hypothetical protein